MDIQPGDVIRMKKPHPCGSVTWEVLRIGQDFPAEVQRMRPSGNDEAHRRGERRPGDHPSGK